MKKGKVLRIEVARVKWTDEDKYVIRVGDVNGSTEWSNVSKKNVLEEIKDYMDGKND